MNQKKLNYYQQKIIVTLGRMYFTSTDAIQIMFVYQPTPDTLELKKKTKVLVMFLAGNQRSIYL